nr:hypothetical protein [Micromonospora sp. DSM 115978]
MATWPRSDVVRVTCAGVSGGAAMSCDRVELWRQDELRPGCAVAPGRAGNW